MFNKKPSFVPKRDHGVDAHGAASWDVAGQDGGGTKQESNCGESQRVSGVDAEQKTLHGPADSDRQYASDGNSNQQKKDSRAQSHAEDSTWFCAQGYAYADLMSALTGRVGNYAVDSHDGQGQAEQAKN